MGASHHGAGRSHFSRLHPVRLGGSPQSLTSTPVGQAHHSRTPALCQHSAMPDLPTASDVPRTLSQCCQGSQGPSHSRQTCRIPSLHPTWHPGLPR